MHFFFRFCYVTSISIFEGFWFGLTGFYVRYYQRIFVDVVDALETFVSKNMESECVCKWNTSEIRLETVNSEERWLLQSWCNWKKVFLFFSLGLWTLIICPLSRCFGTNVTTVSLRFGDLYHDRLLLPKNRATDEDRSVTGVFWRRWCGVKPEAIRQTRTMRNLLRFPKRVVPCPRAPLPKYFPQV